MSFDAEPPRRRDRGEIPGISRRPGDAASKTALLLFGVAAVARVIYLFIYQPSLESYYLGLADSLLTTGVLGFGGRPSTAFEPGYPLFLAAARFLFGERVLLIQLLQTLVGAAGAVLMYRLALQLSSSRATATWAGLLFALHPLLIRQASAASDLAVTTMLVVGFALAFVRVRGAPSAAVAGIVLGLTVLTRAMVLPLVVLAPAILLARRQRREAVALMLAAVAAAAPMFARTYALSGSLAPTRSGVNLYIGNSPHTAALVPRYDLDLLEPEAYERFVRARPDILPEDPRFDAEFDAFLTRQALRHMAEHPWATLGQKLMNVAYLFSPRIAPSEISGTETHVRIRGGEVAGVDASVPRPTLEVAAHAVTSLVLLVGCAAGVYLRRQMLRRDAVLWAILATFAAVNAIYVPATRYTAPIQFVLMFYTAVALVRLREGFRHAPIA